MYFCINKIGGGAVLVHSRREARHCSDLVSYDLRERRSEA